MAENDFLDQMNYIDGITIVDTQGTVLFTIKFNPQFYSEINEQDEIIGENLFSCFPNLDEKTSTLINVMRTGRPIYKVEQKVIDFKGEEIKTTNMSLPIKANGKIIGAIELSRSINKKDSTYHDVIELNRELFKNRKQLINNIQPEQAKYTLKDILTDNKQMENLKRSTEKMAQGTSPVFIYGDTGTGKELFAQALHNASDRAEKPFITQNCAAIPDSLIESILFGTKKGSFTGAEDNAGLFELADGGTLFLDEINSMPVHLQSKLLRVLQDGYIRRLGDKRVRKVDVRVITASNKHPRDCVKDGSLRLDVYYRLSVLMIEIPPLRERKDDIELLTQYFIAKYNTTLKKNVRSVSAKVYDYFNSYHWPGNVRELEHIVEFAINQMDEWEDTLQVKHIEARLRHLIEQEDQRVKIEPMKDAVAKLEKKMISKAIQKTRGNVSQAAKLLEIPRQTLQNKIKSYGIVPKT